MRTNLWIFVISAMLTLSCGSLASAALLLEPGVAYRTGTYDGGAGNTGKVTGVGLNARAAFALPVLFAGVDLSYMFGNTTPDNGPSSDTTAVSFGPVVGASLPALPLRLWAAYLLWDYSTQKISGPPSYDVISSGTAMKLGLGYTAIPLLSVNLEYVMHTYTKAENKLTSTTSDLSPNVKSNEIVISASVPFEL
ncbi:MAG TPA: hypothetical protein VFV50_07830 [Bdellovibrionales bacterium]|nr:hypothetical protein [Bdellovibrionales bacterium]